MTLIQHFFSWIIGKFSSVVVVFAILWLGAFIVGKFQGVKQLGQGVNLLQSLEANIKSQLTKGSAEAQARIKDLDQKAQADIDRQLKKLDEEINRLRDELPSKPKRAIAVAKADMKTLSDWASNEVTIRVKQEERDALARILKYRSELDQFEQKKRDGPRNLERLRLIHVAELQEIAQLEADAAQLRKTHPVLVRIPGTAESDTLKATKTKIDSKAIYTQKLKVEYEEADRSLRELKKPNLPVIFPQDLKIDDVLKELSDARVEIEDKLKQEWFSRVISYEFQWTDLMTTAVAIVAAGAAIPFVIKLLFFYFLAPIATRRPGLALLPNSGGQLLTARDPQGQTTAVTSSVSCRVAIDSSSELLVHPNYVQSYPNSCEARTQWILNRSIPLSSVAAGLYGLTRMRAESPQTVVVSSTRDPLSEVSEITIPKGSSAVLQPRHIVGVIQSRAEPTRITRHWRILNLHAWLTMQLRYLVIHGPVTLVVKGCRGVRVEAAEAGRSLSPDATIGFSANLHYSSRRCETLFSYLSGQKPLLNDSFTGGSGYYVYQEMPYQRRSGFFGRGLEGALDAALKPLGI
jgi:hypothetical protein